MIGLDGTDQVLMNSLVKAGRLPNIERLLQHGNARKVAFPIGASDDSQWAAFQYACDLGHHGRYFWKRTAGFDGRFIFCDDEEEALPAFWQSIGTHCGRVAIFDLPKCRPTPEINGLHLTDWSVQGRYGDRVRSWPTSLANEVITQFGPEPDHYAALHGHRLKPGKDQQFRNALLQSCDAKSAAALHWLQSESWSLFATAFKEIHTASHALWPTSSTHPLQADRDADALQAIFARVDRGLGQLIQSAGKHAAVVLFSTSGFSESGSMDHFGDAITQALNKKLQREHAASENWFSTLSLSIAGLFARREFGNAPWLARVPHIERTLAFRLRESSPRLLNQIRDDLTSLVDASTGQPVFVKVTMPRSEHTGPRAQNLPDVLAVVAIGVNPIRVHSPRLGGFEAAPAPVTAGYHSKHGFVISPPEYDRYLPASLVRMQDLGPAAIRYLGA
jgi:hypothetical protein